jgi:UDP-N-acetyl-2-amino-2-deoxyglucuronate dehydrogenase
VKKFALIGAAGFVAPRHLRAIKDNGHELVAALDVHDTVGILDSYFPEARFFTEFERFDRHVELLRRRGEPIDFVSITSPNYLHDAHARFAMRVGADAICEKPVVINPWNIDGLRAVERESGRKVYTILQLRLHPAVIALREQVRNALATDPDHQFAVSLDYITSRGSWYFSSWKGDERKSGGVAANIGIHFFDMLLWVFGPAVGQEIEVLTPDHGRGRIRFGNATVDWFLSVNAAHLPEQAKSARQRTYRSIRMDGAEVEFSDGFTDLHTESYRRIFAGEGFTLDDAEPSIALVHQIRELAAAKTGGGAMRPDDQG